MNSLKQYEWKNRVVIVFGRAEDDRVARQIAMLRLRPEELQDRDIIVLQVDGEDVRTVHGDAAGLNVGELRKESGVETNGFRVVLVGKDGTPKLASKTVVSDVEIFDLIDQMPMRRSERRGGERPQHSSS